MMEDNTYYGCFECAHYSTCKLYRDYKKSLGELCALQKSNHLAKICTFYVKEKRNK